jgi:hypothetical protein
MSEDARPQALLPDSPLPESDSSWLEAQPAIHRSNFTIEPHMSQCHGSWNSQ